jgi:type II secretory pathway pseudopilin PulG
LRVFINYRHDDTWGAAELLYDRLADSFGTENIFVDTRNLRPGMNWLQEIKSHRDSCGVLLALIGPRWMSAMKRREQEAREQASLCEPAEDYIRLELEYALRRSSGIYVIPVLVGEGVPFTPERLPRSLQLLTKIQAEQVRPKQFEADIAHLIDRLKTIARLKAIPLEQPPMASPMPAKKARAEAEQKARAEAEPVPAEAVPAEAVPAEAVPAEAVPAEPVPAEAALAEPVPAEAVPAEPVPEQKARAEAEQKARAEAEHRAREAASQALEQALRRAQKLNYQTQKVTQVTLPGDRQDVASAQPSQPSPSVTYDDLVRTALAELVQPGRLLFNPPDRMQLGQTERVEVRLTRTPALDAELIKHLRGHGEPQIEDIPTAPLMAVTLKGDGFQITAYSDEEQGVTQSEITTWEFDIRATRRGQQSLIMSVSLRIPVPGQPTEHKSIPVREATIDVTVGAPALIGHFVTSNWQWFIGTAIAIAAVLVAVLFR